ncbi:ZPR1 zinc-finger domain-containing protein [Tricharina praecox]|uniref:ZPR1 zinc-finger domain-containing protein n=1 Tax=Tricharina praecox TaxID=43433 RepID=UPI0022204553|nr:ZPR1 zinc-finger domain-containing protein [Tricharina praecox]KAI5850907.1 ZPR1 zinc-finger domain-containing protein [Tricharina praecox]
MFRSIGDTVDAVDVLAQGDNIDDTDEPQIMDNIESLCMACHEQGNTRLLLTRIPFFREVVLMSFECPHCFFKNCEIQSASEIQERGCTYTLKLAAKEDFDRQVVKSETCVCRVPELDLEIPAQRGQLTTVEGLLSTVLEDLDGDQSKRLAADPEAHAQIATFIARGRDVLAGNALPITLVVDDPSGNSWIEPKPGDARGKWTSKHYERTALQNEGLGLTDADAGTREARERAGEDEDYEIRPDEVHTFPATCPSCVRPCSTHMKLVEIPHFKEVVIMSTVCDSCGYKSNEVKTGGAVPAQGRIITLRVEDAEDLARDILKSETCGMTCPELNLDLTPGTLGGRFTTIEGLLTQVHDELHQRIFSGADDETSDSIEKDTREKWEVFFQGLRDAKDGKRTFTCILDDPLAASYVQNLCAPDPDPQLTIVDVDRTKEQEEELGILDMVTEGYEEAEEQRVKAEKEEKAKEQSEKEGVASEAR